MLYARNVHLTLQPGKDQEFTRLLRTEILPILKKQPGFHSEVALVNGPSAIGISLWNDRTSAEQYASSSYSDVIKKLAPVISGMPEVESYQVAVTTLPETV